MSLIQDALKRKTEEQHTLPPQHTAPSVPPEKPSAPARSELFNEIPPPHSSERKLFSILIAIFVLILLVIGINTFFVLNTSQSKPINEPATETISAPAILELPRPIKPPPTVAAAVQTEKSKLKWPDLNFSGSASAGNQRLVIINGRMLSVGNEIQGAKVLEIGKNKVLIEYKDQKRVLSIDDE